MSLKPEAKDRVVGERSSETDYILRVENRKSLSLKFPRYVHSVPLGKVSGREGKALGRDEGKALVNVLSYIMTTWKTFNTVRAVFHRNVDIKIGKTV
jgi:hypothetical protein